MKTFMKLIDSKISQCKDWVSWYDWLGKKS